MSEGDNSEGDNKEKSMDENTFYLRIWTLVAVCLCVLIVSIVGYYSYQAYLISEAKDPIAFSCANSSTSYGQACIAMAARK